MMKRLTAALAASAMSGGLLLMAAGAPARADTSSGVPFVGGGAAGVQVAAAVIDPPLFQNVLDNYLPIPGWPSYAIGIQANDAFPAVTLPSHGHAAPITAAVLNQTVGSVTVDAVKESTHGTLAGPVYAESSTELTGIHIGGTTIAGLRTHCVWSASGAAATTTLIQANGSSVNVSPNFALPIAGVGTLILNAQRRETLYTGAQVISVAGAEVDLSQATGHSSNDESVNATLQLGFASCDPLIPPGLLSVKSIVPAG